jgi:hypothetical protein
LQRSLPPEVYPTPMSAAQGSTAAIRRPRPREVWLALKGGRDPGGVRGPATAGTSSREAGYRFWHSREDGKTDGSNQLAVLGELVDGIRGIVHDHQIVAATEPIPSGSSGPLLPQVEARHGVIASPK